MSRSQLKLMAAVSALVVLVVAISGAIAERSLHAREMSHTGRSLAERANLVRELLRGIPIDEAQRTALDAVADRAGPAADARVTLIDRHGVVVGDSDVPLSKLAGVENHADRPEVREALEGRVGTSARRSETVGRRLFYLAVPVEGAGSGAIRLAVELSDLDTAVSQLRRDLLVAGSIGLCAALALAFGLAWLALRPLREMSHAASSIAGGDLDSRITLRSIDELGGISMAINQMAEQMRQRLAEATHEKEQLQAVLNGMVEGVLVVDAEGHVLLVNDRMRDFYGVTGVVEGRSPLEVVRDADVEDLLREAAATDEPVSRRIVQIGRDRHTFRVHAVRFPANGGPRMGTVAVFHDITEVAHLEAVRRDFVANASHELRTPVSAIRGFAETLLGNDGLSEGDRRSYLEIIDRHAIRLGRLVADLLALSKIEGRQAETEPERVDVAALAETLVRDSSERLEAGGLAVDLRISRPAVAWGRRQDIEQILSNLVDNAMNYTNAGGRVEVAVECDSQRVRMRVRDTGIGIPWDDQERIFERFYRVDASRSRAAGGTGLGLSIVKHLVLGMNGEISVDSEPGRGSTFAVSLPAASPEAI